MKKSKILVPALAVLALGIAGATTGTVAWFAATNNATVQMVASEGWDVKVNSSSANAAEVTFTSAMSAKVYNLAGGSTSESSGVVLTNASGQTGYLANNQVYLRSLAATEAGYGTISVTVTATKTAGDGTLYEAIQSLDSQGFKIFGKATVSGYARASFSATSNAQYAGSLNTSVTATSGLDPVDDATGLSSSCTSVTYSYTVYFSIAPKNQADAAHGAEAGTPDVPADHAADEITVDTSVIIPA